MQVSTIDIPTADGVADAIVAKPDGGGQHPAVLLHMDGVGLRPALEDMASRFASHGYYVLAPNAFYRNGRAPLLPLDQLMTLPRPPELMARMMEMIGALTPDVVARDLETWMVFLDAQEEVAPGPIGTVGYCMGGALALRTAAAFPGRVAAAASLHGGNLARPVEGSPHLLAPQLRAEIYVGHADEDPSASPEQIELLQTSLEAAGLRYEAEVLTGARHGFTMVDLPVYDKAAAERHWDKVVGLFDRTLKAA